MGEKKALKGFCAVRVWPITANTPYAYTTGAVILLPAAQSLTKDVTRGDYTIYADDSVYDTGSDYQNEELELTLAELTPELEAMLSGGDYDEETGEYTFKNTDIAPEFALGYAALRSDGKYRMFKHYAAKLISVKVDHATKGDSNDIAPYTLTFRNTQRNADGAIRVTKDSEDGTHTWLDTIDQIGGSEPPAAPNSSLSSLTIGSLTLTPLFQPTIYAYEASTTNVSDIITATAAKPGATIEITVEGVPIDNGDPASWASGENEVVIKVTDGAQQSTYTVIVTKT